MFSVFSGTLNKQSEKSLARKYRLWWKKKLLPSWNIILCILPVKKQFNIYAKILTFFVLVFTNLWIRKWWCLLNSITSSHFYAYLNRVDYITQQINFNYLAFKEIQSLHLKCQWGQPSDQSSLVTFPFLVIWCKYLCHRKMWQKFLTAHCKEQSKQLVLIKNSVEACRKFQHFAEGLDACIMCSTWYRFT